MTQYTGKVSKTYPSRYGGSFGLDGQHGLYFNTKGALPAFVVAGATVSFEGQIGRNGKSVFVTDTSLVESSPPPAAAAASGGGNNWDQRQDNIVYQSSRKDALVAVGLLLANGAIKLPEAPAKRAGAIEAIIDRFTAVYFEDVQNLGALERTPVPEPAAKAAAAVSETQLEE